MREQLIEESLYANHVSLLQKYVAHAKETVRLSILGILIIGIIFFWGYYWNVHPLSITEQVFLVISLFFFSIAAGYSLKLGFIAIKGIDPDLYKENDEDKDQSLLKEAWKELMRKCRLLFMNNTIHTGLGIFFFIIALLFFLLPPYPAKDQAGCNDGRIDINIIQLNDVYEIAPLDEGKIAGMARVATLKKEYLQKNVNTVMVMAGDFLSPSVFNNVRYNGSRVMGLQMVEAMNVAGFDLVAFGNHEFDLNKNSLQKCIDAGSFEWIASNTFEICCSGKGSFNQRARPLPRFLIKTFTDDDGTIGKVGFIGLTIETNTNEYVKYDSANATAKLLYDQISNYCDAVVAITHQSMDADIRLAKRVPGLTAIIGGHEHDGRDTVVNNVRITKADANAKNAFVLTLTINKNSTKPVRLTVEERKLDSTVLQDKYTAEIVNKWMKIASDSFKALGFDLKDIVFTSGRQLDGRDEKVRYDTTNLTNAIVAAMMKAYTEAQGAIFNAGSIRIDDYLMIPVTQYEILRALPYIDSIKLVQIKGSILKKILDAGRNLPSGDGMFLHYSTTISCSTLTNSWLLNNSEIKNDDNYTIAIAGYILSGKEPAFSFLKTETIESKSAGKPIDMNHALIDYLKANGETVAHTSNKKQ